MEVPQNHLQSVLQNGYSERQASIIRGDIPYERASGHDYRRIKEKAIKLGDYEIAGRMEALQWEKRQDLIEANRESARERYRRSHPNADCCSDDSEFTEWELELLEGEIDYTRYTER